MKKLTVVALSLTFLYIGRFTDSVIIKSLPILLIIVLFVKSFPVKGTFLPKNRKRYYLWLTLILMVLVGLIRNNAPNLTVFQLISFGIFFTALTHIPLFLIKKWQNPEKVLLYLLIYPYGVYIFINIFLYYIGVRASDAGYLGQAVLLSKIGVHVDRVYFPLASGINTFGSVTGGYFVVLLSQICFGTSKKKLHYWILAFFAIWALLLTDTRAAIFLPILIVLILKYRVIKWRKISFVKIMPLVPIIGPIILAFLLLNIPQDSIFNVISRDKGELATGNARFLIWGLALNELSVFKLQQIIGYGNFGHYVVGIFSNLSSQIDTISTEDDTSLLFQHPHNTVLTLIFDYGYLGLTVFILMLRNYFNYISIIWNSHKNFALIMLSYGLYFVLAGMTESFWGFYYQNSIYIYVIMFSYSIVNYPVKPVTNKYDNPDELSVNNEGLVLPDHIA